MRSYKIYFAHFVSHVHLMFVPAMLPFLPEFFDVGYLELGAGMSVLMTVTLILQIPMGFITDRYGPRRMLAYGMLASAAALFWLAFAPSFEVFLITMMVLGVANTIYHPSDYALLAENVSPDRLGRAFGMHTFSGYFGAAVTPVALYATTTLISVNASIFLLGLIALIAVYVLEPLHKVLAGRPFTLFSPPERTSAPSRGVAAWKDRDVRKSRINLGLKIMVLMIFFAFLHASLAPIQEFGNATLMTGYGFNEADAAVLISLFLLVLALGILLGGWLADKTERHGLIAAYSFLVTAGFMALVTFVAMPIWMLYGLILLVGLLSGLITPSRDMMVKKIAPKGAEGRVFGIVSTGFSIGGAFAPIYLAWFLDNNLPQWVFASAVIAMIVVVIISFAQEGTVIMRRRVPEEPKTSTEPIAIVD